MFDSWGGIVTIASAAMLGVGTQYKYSPMKGYDFGVGSLNYGKTWYNGKEQPTNTVNSSYNKFVEDAKNLLKSGFAEPQAKKLAEAVVLANDLMIAGAVLVSISSLVLIAGIVLLVLNLKKRQ